MTQSVRAWEEMVTIPTYSVQAADKNPMFLDKRVYQGSSGKVYPLTLTAHNGAGVDATQTFHLTVNQPAGISSRSEAILGAGTAGTFTVTCGVRFVCCSIASVERATPPS